MAKKSTWVVGIILLCAVSFVAVFSLGTYLLFRPERIEVRQDSVLEVSVSTELAELPPVSPLARLFSSDGVNIIDLERGLRHAAMDPRIRAVSLELYPLVFSWAQVEELRGFVQDFRKSGKKVVVRMALDAPQEKELYLASPADKIYLNPDSGLLINGLVAEINFYRKMMDKLKIEPQFLMFKEFKSPEPYSRDKMTPEIRSMLEGILKDIQDRFIHAVAQERKIEEPRLRQLIQIGLIPASLALKERLVTALGYEDDVRSQFEVGKPGGGKEYRSIGLASYLQSLDSRFQRRVGTRVALLGGIGAITSGGGDETWENFIGGETISARLRSIREDKTIKGVLFRVDSPGGSAVGSDKIWREVRLLEKSGKPVVVSMSGVAGSGGYYIAMGARKIVAQPSTITGSIGVIFGKFNIRGLYEQWLGITPDKVKMAENADIFSPTTSLSEAQKTVIRNWMEEIYNNFVKKAAEGRGMSYEQLEPMAHGRIYTGNQARQLKLVDEVGGYRMALSVLKKELHVPEKEELEVVLYPRPKSFWESLIQGDFFRSESYRPSLGNVIKSTLHSLETPAPWLLMPSVEIH
ncbi:MAG TPA: signal peptide peptidase SppA [Terriglobia bacterium]|nr:signal peptide peptidase SppA [Terriglobia bacterium]